MLANKADQIPALKEEIEVFREFTGLKYPVIATSATTGEGLDQIGPWLFHKLAVVRVYTKAPGRPPDTDRPFTVRRGQTVHEVAGLVHKEIADSLRYARLWRAGQPHGQQVGLEHTVEDGDVVEMHA
jgi:hypothetical protein